MKDPTKWSQGALDAYQRARSGPVRIIRADGTVEDMSAWEAEKLRRAKRAAKPSSKSERSATHWKRRRRRKRKGGAAPK